MTGHRPGPSARRARAYWNPGAPLPVGSGTLEAGSANAVDLSAAAPRAPAGLFVALSSTPADFDGGTLVPVPALLLVRAATDGGGTVPLPFVMPPGVPAATQPWLQRVIQDAGAVQGVAPSNALPGLVP